MFLFFNRSFFLICSEQMAEDLKWSESVFSAKYINILIYWYIKIKTIQKNANIKFITAPQWVEVCFMEKIWTRFH